MKKIIFSLFLIFTLGLSLPAQKIIPCQNTVKPLVRSKIKARKKSSTRNFSTPIEFESSYKLKTYKILQQVLLTDLSNRLEELNLLLFKVRTLEEEIKLNEQKIKQEENKKRLLFRAFRYLL